MIHYTSILHLALRPMTAAILLVLASGTAIAQTQNTTTNYQYDANGNLTQITDPLGHVTNQVYDPLNRMVQQLQAPPTAGAPRPIIGYAYDGIDQLVSVTDPRNLSTSYTIDGLGNQTALTSPDSGASSKGYDAAGNVVTSTDAKGQTTGYQYDALNRITRITYHDGSTTNYAYDQNPNGIGRLTEITDANGTIRYGYDGFGRVTSELRIINGTPYATGYAYDTSGRLQSMTYPNGRIVSYTRDSLGRISQISSTKDDVTLQLVTQVDYQPFGPVRKITFGNGQVSIRNYDLDGRAASFTLNGQIQNISYDAASRITAITDPANALRSASYGYDDLDRLTSYQLPNTSQSYGYDATGNRTTKVNNAAVTNYSYPSTSNKLSQVSGNVSASIATDPNGSITNNGNADFTYDVRGRLIAANTPMGLVQYQINALGQRIKKTTTAGSTVFHYDQGGKLIAENGVQGNSDYVYLGDIPVAVLK